MQSKEGAELNILRFLKTAGGRPVSGEEIRKALRVSRTAVWKHITSLRKAGYDINASPSKGYCLAAPRHELFNGLEVLSGLRPGVVGRAVFFHLEAPSTNVIAKRLARAGEGEGAVVIADAQTNGRGRLGRVWESPPGVNLYTSIILRPSVPPSEAQRLTLVMAIAVAEAVSAFSPIRPSVKWPNDVLINSKKVSGILMEMDAEADHVSFVIAGVGVNINMDTAILPEPIRRLATSLREVSGKDVSRVMFGCALYSSVEKWYKIFKTRGFSPILEGWRSYFDSEGKAVRVNVLNGTISGICMGIDDSGALLIKTAEGRVERVISGDVEA